MKIVGCDLHARQQTIAMVDTETGEFTEKTLFHEGNVVRAFYAALEGPVVVGIEATGAMQWFLELLEELGIECRVGHPAKIRAKETRKQKYDRRDARLILELLVEDRFPEIWMPSTEQRDQGVSGSRESRPALNALMREFTMARQGQEEKSSERVDSTKNRASPS
jgi:transposase